ncbi:TadE/TadG family type IV pilus assembly protein [Sneathiella chinensis]|uniref:TadE-like domain-containing protein n=1 Tax=Sneathiella chinensis TaxID=349750 RepID=A0ABQ5TZR7_9PROT|nr:TadE/TadG family type IV pilus assembly protein [Sneathiella chinensis]GLQ05063.1 hypothetical protein GCM10007924_02840 [Sneathiella chinensis]
MKHRLHRGINRLIRSTRGVAAVELALLAPLLLILTFGSIDVVRALRDYNIVSKSLRDSGRFLARVPIDCSQAAGSRIPAGLQTMARQMALTGKVGASPAQAANRLVEYWTDENSVAIQVSCVTNSDANNLCGGVGETTACRGDDQIPVVQVSADFAYVGTGISLLQLTNMRIRASHSQMGIKE